MAPETVDEVSDALAAHDYRADEGLATAVFLALRLQRPLLLEGEAGVGKTEVAKVLSRWTGGSLLRLQCYEGIDVGQAVYEWDYSRQLLHLRAAEVGGHRSGQDVEGELYSERFLVRRPLLAAIAHGEGPPPVLLIDEHTVDVTLGTVLKYREDQERVRAGGVGDLVRQAVLRG